jgi:hypothetical protein
MGQYINQTRATPLYQIFRTCAVSTCTLTNSLGHTKIEDARTAGGNAVDIVCGIDMNTILRHSQ